MLQISTIQTGVKCHANVIQRHFTHHKTERDRQNKGRNRVKRREERDLEDEVRVRIVNMMAMHKRPVTMHVGAHCSYGDKW